MAAAHRRQGRAVEDRRLTALGRFTRDLLERLLGRYREGPDPPPRLAEEARLFRLRSPAPPTEEEWEAFCSELADRAYRDGFVRGVHWLERSWDGPSEDPEKILELEAHAAARYFPEGELPEPADARAWREYQEARAWTLAVLGEVDPDLPRR